MPEANNANGAADSAIKSAKRMKITGELIIPSTNGEQINKLIIKGFLKWFKSLNGFHFAKNLPRQAKLCSMLTINNRWQSLLVLVMWR